MKIDFYGHSCFRIKCKDLSILIDPYHSNLGLDLPKIKSDVVLVTHNHDDHNNTKLAGKEALIINGPGEYEVKGTFISGQEAFHDNAQGTERGVITMYLIENEKVKIAHLGDLGQKQLSKKQLEFLEGVDVLLIPVGGVYTINAHDAINIINEIEPRIIIPMHYAVPGLKLPKHLDSIDNFIKEIGLSPEKLNELKVSKDSLPSSELKLIILNRLK